MNLLKNGRGNLILSIYDYISLNDGNPHIIVNTMMPGVCVPNEYVAPDGSIILNINASAVLNLSIDNDAIAFSARFSGKSMDIYIPIYAVDTVFCKNTTWGMRLIPDPAPVISNKEEHQEKGPVKSSKRPSLKLVE